MIQRVGPIGHEKKSEKTLDKPLPVWYNKSTTGELINPNKQRNGAGIMSTKVTNKSAILFAMQFLPADTPDEIMDKLNNMIIQLDKKNAAPKKLTAQQEKNEEIKTALYNFLVDNAPNGFTVSDLLKEVPELNGDSNQHVSALLRALFLAGSIEKYSEKRRTYFRVSVDNS